MPSHFANTVVVLNGTTVPGLARDTSYKLAVAGYHTRHLPAQILADAPSQSYYSNDVYFDPVQPNARQAARQLRVSLGPHTIVAPLPPELGPYAQQSGNPLTVLVVGRSFNGELVNPEAHRAPTPERQPPHVVSDPGLTLSGVRDMRHRLPFRPMVPHVIAANSTLAQLEPLRVFKPAAGRKELALTFVTGAGNVYWQVIETNWTSAPILRRPTSTYRLHGRTFQIFTNGAHIHMAVLRTPKASYWVVNTLRDELSNETMLAIARGLLPLGQ